MVQYIFSPRWFFGIDIAFELFSMIIAFLIARYGHKLYTISNDKKHKHFYSFFFLIGLALAFKTASNFDIYYLGNFTMEIANTVFYFTSSRISEIVYILGFSVFRFFMLLSMFGLLYITWDSRRETFLLVAYFIAIITIFSEEAYYAFHITMAVMLMMLFRHYYLNYKASRRPSRGQLLTAISFLMLLLSQVAFATLTLSILMYVVGEILQLAGFTLLLGEYIMVTRDEK